MERAQSAAALRTRCSSFLTAPVAPLDPRRATQLPPINHRALPADPRGDGRGRIRGRRSQAAAGADPPPRALHGRHQGSDHPQGIRWGGILCLPEILSFKILHEGSDTNPVEGAGDPASTTDPAWQGLAGAHTWKGPVGSGQPAGRNVENSQNPHSPMLHNDQFSEASTSLKHLFAGTDLTPPVPGSPSNRQRRPGPAPAEAGL